MEKNNRQPTEILIVEDSSVQIVKLQYILENHGYQVLTANNGEAALNVLKHHKPTLIISDIVMPKMDGYALCRHVKQDERLKDIPIILLTALSDLQDVVRALADGADNFVTKPYTEEFLMSRIRHVLVNQEIRKQDKIDSGVEIFFDNQKFFLSSEPAQTIDLLLSTFENAVQKNLELEEINQQLLSVQRELRQKNLDLVRLNDTLKSLNERLQGELLLARRIQQSLLPPSFPNWPILDVNGYSTPAREVGGDFYVYHDFSADPPPTENQANQSSDLVRYAVAVGDVSGKGMPAALLMAVSIAFFQANVPASDSPAKLLQKLDQAIDPYTQTTRLNCALCYAEILVSTTTQQAKLFVANAGCVMPIIKHVDGTVRWVEVGGMPLGVKYGQEFGYTELMVELSKGDLVIFSSDGLIEAQNGQADMFSFDRFEQAVTDGPTSSSTAMLKYLKTEINAFVGDTEPHDDMTIVVLQV